MSAVPVEEVVAQTSIEDSSLQWRFPRQCRVDKDQEHFLQSVTKCYANTRRISHANIVLSGVAKDDLTLSMVFPFIQALFSEASQAKQHRSRSWRRFRCSLLSPFRETEQHVFRCNNETRFDGPCQDAGEGFGFQEESEVEALLSCESLSYAYCCHFGVPYDCIQGITAPGQCSQISSVPMWTRFASGADHPCTFLTRLC